MQSYMSIVKNLVQTGQEYIKGGKTKVDEMQKISKTQAIYEARSFNDTHLDTTQCVKTLAKLTYLFSLGEQQFTKDQSDQLFFAITKLLQTEDPQLKRVVYMTVKQMRNQPSIYIVTSSLLKDIHHKNKNFRRNSLRTIPMVLDPSNLVQVQRYIKGLITDKDYGVASAALLSGIQMFGSNEEMVRKWGSQIADKTNSPDPYVQYHGIILLSDIKKKDNNAFKKFLFTLMKQTLSGIAIIQLLRISKQISKNLEYDSAQAKDFINFVNRNLRNPDDSVVLEAAKVACQSSLMGNKDLMDVIKILETYLVSESNVKKYAVLKIYNNLLKNPSRKNLIINVKQIEKVLTDKNMSLSSIAASLLLRICSEGYLEKLLKQIGKTFTDMSNDYKIDVLRSLGNVLKSYPKKFQAVNKLLIEIVQKVSDQKIKSEAIKVLQFQIQEIGGQAKSACLKHLIKFLSKVSFQKIHFQILGIVSRQVGKQDLNSDILKHLIEQVYLQEGPIRACGLSTLIKVSKFQGQKISALKQTIMKFKDDNDEQVRARVKLQSVQQQKQLGNYELDLIQNYLHHNCQQIQASANPEMLNFGNMKKWGEEVGSSIMKPPKIQEEAQTQQNNDEHRYKQIFENHSTFKNYGSLRKINKPIQISDSEGQLLASARVFLFDDNLVLEYRINNKLHDQGQLQDVRIDLKHSGDAFKVQHIIPCKVIKSEDFGDCYVGLSKAEQCEDLFPEDKISSIVKYTVKQYSGDNVKTSYQDEFSLQDYEIKLSNYMTPWFITPEDFTLTWEKMEGHEDQSTFQLNYASTQAAMQELSKHFGMYTVQTTDSGNNKNMINLSLAGKFLNTHQALILLMIAFDTKMGCLLKMKVKSATEQLTDQLIASIH